LPYTAFEKMKKSDALTWCADAGAGKVKSDARSDAKMANEVSRLRTLSAPAGDE
jgi:hypothetical protein